MSKTEQEEQSTVTTQTEETSSQNDSEMSSDSQSDSSTEQKVVEVPVDTPAKETVKVTTETSSEESDEASADDESDASTSVSDEKKEDVKVETKAEESSDESTEARDTFNSAGKTVFMKNFSGDISEEEIRSEIEKIGEIHELRVPKKREHKKTRGFLICCFKDRKSVVAALKLNNTTFLNCKIYVEELKDGLKKREDHKEERTQKREYNKENEGERATAFVSNLPYEVDEYAFKKYIENLGNIRNIRIPQDKETGRKRGFAFFEFNDKSDMEKMMKMNLIWDDRKLFMRESEARREDGDRNGRGDSRDRGRGSGRGVERKSFSRDGDRKSYSRDGDRRSNNRDGDRKSFSRDGNKGGRNDRADKENVKKIKFEDSDS